MKIACAVTYFVHHAHLARWCDGVTGLDEQRRCAHRLPLRPVVAGAPLGRDFDPAFDMAVQPPAGRGPVESLKEVLSRDRAELSEYLFNRVEFGRQSVQPWFPRASGAAAEVR